MLSAVLGILGYLAPFLPEVFKAFQQKRDNVHEIEILKLQMEANQKLNQQKIDSIDVESRAKLKEAELLADVESDKLEQANLNDRIKTNSGVKWVAAFCELIRPMVTSLLVLDYLIFKLASLTVLINSGLLVPNALVALFTDFDQALLMTVIGFWFGKRTLEKHRCK